MCAVYINTLTVLQGSCPLVLLSQNLAAVILSLNDGFMVSSAKFMSNLTVEKKEGRKEREGGG